MILKLGMDHKVLKVYKASTNDDHGFALTYVMAKSNLVKIAQMSGDLLQDYCGPMVFIRDVSANKKKSRFYVFGTNFSR